MNLLYEFDNDLKDKVNGVWDGIGLMGGNM